MRKNLPNFIHEESEYINEIQKSIDDGDNFQRKITKVSSFSPAELTQCPRRLYYKHTEKEPEFTKMDKDTPMSKAFMEQLKKTNLNVIFDLQFADWNHNICGNLNGLWQTPETPSKSSEYLALTWHFVESDQLEKMPSRSHVVANIVFMWLNEKAKVRKGIIVYVASDQKKYYQIDYSEAIIKSVKTKCRQIMDAALTGKLIDRPYKELSEECKVCEFGKVCWESK